VSLLRIISILRNIFRILFTPLTTVPRYSILKPCYRCKYSKGREGVLIVSISGYSRDYTVLAIVNHKHNTYANIGKCLGYNNCHMCLDAISEKKYPCKWIKI